MQEDSCWKPCSLSSVLSRSSLTQTLADSSTEQKGSGHEGGGGEEEVFCPRTFLHLPVSAPINSH